MNKKIDITVCVQNKVLIDRIFFVKPGNSAPFFVSAIKKFIKEVKTGKVKKGSLEK
jgi:hypothetical protein